MSLRPPGAGAINHWSSAALTVMAVIYGAILLVVSVLEVRLIDRVQASHGNLLASRLGTDRRFYP